MLKEILESLTTKISNIHQRIEEFAVRQIVKFPTFISGNLNFWPIAITWGLTSFVLALLYLKVYYRNYFMNLFFHADCMINAMCGGSPVVTVSSRLGKYVEYYEGRTTITAYLWRFMAGSVDWAFKAAEKDHCKNAYLWIEDKYDIFGNKLYAQHGPGIVMLLFTPAVVGSALILKVVITLLVVTGLLSVDEEGNYQM